MENVEETHSDTSGRNKRAESVLALAKEFATSFTVGAEPFRITFDELLAATDVCLLVAEVDAVVTGYALGFDHPVFYANGRVTWVEEIMVHPDHRRTGIGRALMEAIETWSRSRGSRLIALATRRAASFYRAIGYEESAVYFRRLL